MKTNNMVQKILKVMGLMALALSLANCSKNDSSSSTTGTYSLISGVCYQNVNGTYTQVATTYCSSTTGTYTYMNGLCYQNVNGTYTQVATTYCSSTTTGTYTSQVCSGNYTDGTRWALCTPGATGITYSGNYMVMNCSGYRLYNSSYQIVQCL
ncbi:MAG: hypothetical protein AAGB31_08230 [Bdellovibrio sp.]